MRQRLGVIITIVVAIGVLIVVNSVAYVSKEEQQDSELSPNRSSYNAGPTGTRALYDFLSESGYKVVRWREAPERLLGTSGERIRTFVIIGTPRVSIEEEEAKSLLRWVERGGRLVIIDRRPENYLLPPSGDWRVTTELLNFPGFGLDPERPEQLTEGVKPLSPILPTLLTRNVESVMPSKFFSSIKLFTSNEKANAETKKGSAQSTPEDEAADDDDFFDETPPSAQSGTGPVIGVEESSSSGSPAPVVHLTAEKTVVLLDYLHGKGRIVLLSDPFIVANSGIGLKDNLRLAINLLSTSEGLTAFDEFHQGRAATHNEFVSYFEGTPVLAICGQLVFLLLLVLWTRGRRFARPLPLPHVDRRSSLEFVASMAELQQRARALDLAIENVYSRTRRVLARYAGVDYNSPRTEIAARVAARSSLSAHQIETVMRQSEDAINGGAISERQSIHLVKRLREMEGALGLRMRSREVKQTAQNI
ncbi:MAG TPA: DUF4350 domain-containing protein [Pyrinomonadaceae bacterium]|jgi:Domain of unknown function (DUF4350)